MSKFFGDVRYTYDNAPQNRVYEVDWADINHRGTFIKPREDTGHL